MVSSVSGSSFSSAYAIDDIVRASARSLRGAVSSKNGAESGAASQTAEQGVTLTPEQERRIRELEAIDREVHAHEQAHISVGADLILSGPTYEYETGPDEKRYAVGGEVTIDTSPARTPEETIPKAQHIRETALAPVDPSAQDHRVASIATQLEGDARVALQTQQRTDATSSYDSMESAEMSVGTRLDLFV